MFGFGKKSSESMLEDLKQELQHFELQKIETEAFISMVKDKIAYYELSLENKSTENL